MSEPRLLVPGPLTAGAELVLDAERSNYLCRVLRRRRDDRLRVFDGYGHEHGATVKSSDPKAATVTVGMRLRESPPPPFQLHLALALIKGERFDWALSKATELGVTQLTPLVTERTDVRLSGERLARRSKHWRRVIESASAQSERLYVPRLEQPLPLEALLASVPSCAAIVLTPGAPAFEPPAEPQDLLLLIGPEGGLSAAEQQRCIEAGLIAAGLGNLILRAETVPLVVLTAVRASWGWVSPEVSASSPALR